MVQWPTNLRYIYRSSPTTPLATFIPQAGIPLQISPGFGRRYVASGKEPWKAATGIFMADTSLAANYTPRPQFIVRRDTNWPPGHKGNSTGDNEFSQDCVAAYYCMIRWIVTKDQQWAAAALRIIDAWSAVLQGMGGWDQMLAAGLYGGHLAQAAELLAHATPDWQYKQRAQTMFLRVLHPVCAHICGRDSDGSPMPKPQACEMGKGANGNWDAVCVSIQAIIIGSIKRRNGLRQSSAGMCFERLLVITAIMTAEYVGTVARSGYDAMVAADPEAVWCDSAWRFLANEKWWMGPKNDGARMKGVPPRRA